MSNQIAAHALHNPHESFDSITPLDESESELRKTTAPTSSSPSLAQQQRRQPPQSTDDFARDYTDSADPQQQQIRRTNSLDSLANSEHNSNSNSNSSIDDDISDSDSLCELKRLSSLDSKANDPPRQSDLEEIIHISEAGESANNNNSSGVDVSLVNVVVPNEPVIKAFLEKSHQYGCDYEDCDYKQQLASEDYSDQSSEKQVLTVRNNNNSSSNYLLPPPPAVKLSRKSSLVNSEAIRRMETILEEPIEPKISVKEILARFETMRETAELQSKPASISSGVKAAAATLNVPIEKFEITNGISSASPTEQHQLQQQLQQQQQLMKRVEPHSNNNGGEHAFNQNGYASRKSSTPLQEQNGVGSIMHLHEDSSTINQTSIVKHSLLQFALQHFRNDSPEAYQKSRSSEERSLEERFNANLVKWQSYPLKHPLLKLPQDLNALALECFECILRYCGDMPQDREFTEVKCVYTILMHCHKHVILRDEVYCQLMKQTTANRSTCSDSLQRAWRLLSILAAYFSCSDALKPYLVEHLTSAASDRRGTAAVCLANLRKTARCGGRKNVPSVEEVTAVSAGRSARRQIYRLPGGAERVVNTRCSTVVADVIAELCALLGIDSEIEQQEFSLYCIVQGDAFTMPLSSDEYILDVTTELLKTNQPFYLIFCRSVWHFPLKREPVPLYIEVLFNQVAPDYLEGLLLELPNHMGAPKSEYIKDISRIAAILHRAADLNHIPVMKEIKFLLPKPALALREIKPAQWVNYVQAEFVKVSPLSPLQCKAQFLSILSKWPLFGSSFFAVKRVFGDDMGAVPDDDNSAMYRELILALNYRGVLFLDSNTHDTLHHWNFIEIISTRKVRSDDALFLDIKVGNLLQQNVIRVQTEQAHEISRIMKQYITMAQKTGQRE